MDHHRLSSAVTLLRTATGAYNPGSLTGSSNARTRQAIVSELLGRKVRQADCGVNAVCSALLQAFAIPTGFCPSVRAELLADAMRELVAVDLANGLPNGNRETILSVRLEFASWIQAIRRRMRTMRSLCYIDALEREQDRLVNARRLANMLPRV